LNGRPSRKAVTSSLPSLYYPPGCHWHRRAILRVSLSDWQCPPSRANPHRDSGCQWQRLTRSTSSVHVVTRSYLINTLAVWHWQAQARRPGPGCHCQWHWHCTGSLTRSVTVTVRHPHWHWQRALHASGIRRVGPESDSEPESPLPVAINRHTSSLSSIILLVLVSKFQAHSGLPRACSYYSSSSSQASR
jgi:hypothetical protein